MSICWHFHNSTIRSKMLLNVRAFKRYQAWLAFVHLGFTLNPRFRSTGSWRLGEVTGRCGLLFWVSLYKTSKTNTSEPAFTTIINKSQKKKKWMFSRSKEELASIEDGQNSRVEKEVLLRSGWYDCVLSLVVLCLWDAKLMIVFALVVGKDIRRFKRGWKFPAVAHSQNTGIRWRGGP